MRGILKYISLFIVICSGLQGQTRITGVVKDAFSNKEIYNLNVGLLGTGIVLQTDRIGYFQLNNIKDGTYTLYVSGEGYDYHEQEVIVNGEKKIELGDIWVVFNPNQSQTGVVVLSTDELNTEQSFSGILQSSNDVFSRVSAYQLGAYRFNARGYLTEDYDLRMNGIPMRKFDNGRAVFADWGGLNDIFRRPGELTYGIEPSQTAFGKWGGVTNYESRSSKLRKGISMAYSLTDRTSYKNRLMMTYNTGLSAEGWGFTVSASKRWAKQGEIDGTLYDAWSYYLNAEKKINEKHSLNLAVWGAPNRRSMSSANTEEVTGLKGRDYNAYWGWQDGKRRNERIRKTHQPLAMLSHYWKIDPETQLTTTFSYQFGKDQRSRLSWYKASNPSPTYHRNLPSYYSTNGANQEVIDEVVYAWKNDETYNQIDWASLYKSNLENLEGRASYMLVADTKEEKIASFNSNFKKQLTDRIGLIVAVTYQNSIANYYQEILDLLGAQYALNHDYFSDATLSGNYNERDREIRKVRKGDRFIYDYKINTNYWDAYVQTEMKWNKIDWTVGMMASVTTYQREGKYEHYSYKDRSYGKSKTYTFSNLGAKSQFLYKIDGRNFIQWNGQYNTAAPVSDYVFGNARINDYTLPDLKNEKLYATDLSYVLRASKTKIRSTFYYAFREDGMEKSFGFVDGRGIDDGNSYFGSEMRTGVDKEYLGGELAFERQLTSTLNVYGVIAIGQYTYKNNPELYLFYDDVDTDVGYASYGKTYIDKYHLASGPQQGYSLGLEYRSPSFWWIGISGNYLAQNYIGIAGFRRTDEFVSTTQGDIYSDITQEEVKDFLKQTKASDEFMFNMNLGKIIRFGQYSMGITLTVNNVLNNKKYITGGFEQLRIGDYKKAVRDNYKETFGPKLWYDQGRSFFANVYFRF